MAVAVTCVVVVSHPWEGPVLLAFSKGHGVHVSDLIVVAVGAGVIMFAWLTQRRPQVPDPEGKSQA